MNTTLDAVTDTRDALRVRYASEFALRKAGATSASLLVLPAFPAVAVRHEPELFHVTAFRPWMAPVEDVLRAACHDRGVAYHIGHEDLDPQIVQAVWKGIARAQRVVCDLTLLNPNAVLELAVAQAMGRPVLILSRHGDVARWLPIQAKTRMHTYTVDPDGLTALRALLDRFMDDGEP